jgi:hypothetical protein|tara:strand:- start:1 stop:345 length:345 start_codon:yes stop_codon:yes gene_type:complete
MALENKTDFDNLELGLKFVTDLSPVTYKWESEECLDVGFKVEEVQALEIASGYDILFKNNILTTPSEDGSKVSIEYIKFVPVLVNAIKELSAKNEDLLTRIETLELSKQEQEDG